MPGENLTRDEARERAELLTVSAYEVSLDVTASATTKTAGCLISTTP